MHVGTWQRYNVCGRREQLALFGGSSRKKIRSGQPYHSISPPSQDEGSRTLLCLWHLAPRLFEGRDSHMQVSDFDWMGARVGGSISAGFEKRLTNGIVGMLAKSSKGGKSSSSSGREMETTGRGWAAKQRLELCFGASRGTTLSSGSPAVHLLWSILGSSFPPLLVIGKTPAVNDRLDRPDHCAGQNRQPITGQIFVIKLPAMHTGGKLCHTNHLATVGIYLSPTEPLSCSPSGQCSETLPTRIGIERKVFVWPPFGLFLSSTIYRSS